MNVVMLLMLCVIVDTTGAIDKARGHCFELCESLLLGATKLLVIAMTGACAAQTYYRTFNYPFYADVIGILIVSLVVWMINIARRPLLRRYFTAGNIKN